MGAVCMKRITTRSIYLHRHRNVETGALETNIKASGSRKQTYNFRFIQ